MSKPRLGILWGDLRESAVERAGQFSARAGTDASQKGLAFAPSRFDRVVIGRVRRPVGELRSHLSDRFGHGAPFVGCQVVPHNRSPRSKLWSEYWLEKGQKHGAIGRPRYQQRRPYALAI
jgi:hypothetical protein